MNTVMVVLVNSLFFYFFMAWINLKNFISENLRIEFMDNFLESAKIGLFIGVSFSSLALFLLKIFGLNNYILIIFLYFYPLAGLLSAYLVFRKTKELEIGLERGYHG